jgi:stage IV sporulation protein FB
MNLFAPPPPTRYDLRFTVFRVPVRIHPLFWIAAVLFGGIAGNLLFLLVWVVAVFVSILVHELGHALTMRRFGMDAQVVLYVLGGVTVPQAVPWGGRWAYVPFSPLQEAAVSFAGPAVGFLLAGLVTAGVAAAGGTVVLTALYGIVPMPAAILPFGGVLQSLVSILLWINVLWGLVNLMPVYPLDGGNIIRRLLIKVDPLDGARKAHWIAIAAGGLLALAGFFLFRSIYLAVLFGYLAYLNYQTLHGGYGEL